MEMLRNLENQINNTIVTIVDIVPACTLPDALPERVERKKALSGSAMIAWE
jgi:hypothetical protein